ncbi:hypothetical protein SAMD00024442_14_47 [Candidatus Symbiothrix dinenymphae]|nr:hypothetical protein SAMD00024442_14_47 [Candidatus Symbiothrix dinenymphae]
MTVSKRILVLFFCVSGALQVPVSPVYAQNLVSKADSIIFNTIDLRDNYKNLIRNYQSEVYIKGSTLIKKQNALYKYAPNMLYLDHSGNNQLVECLIDIDYRSPNIFSHELKAIRGGRTAANDIQNRILLFLNVNIYNSSIINDQMLIPETKQLFKYYDFKYIQETSMGDALIHQIELIPKAQSQRLMTGYFYIVDGSWNIYRTDIRGRWEFYNFRVQTTYGIDTTDFLLPLQAEISLDFKMPGNHTESRYAAYYKYESVEYGDVGVAGRVGKDGYNLTTRADTVAATVPYITDSLFWAKKRPLPLSADEQLLLEKPDSFSTKAVPAFWKYAVNLVVPQSFSSEETEVAYSGFLNPLKVSYSHSTGFIYWQNFRLLWHLPKDQELLFEPSVGYMFREEKFYFTTPLQWLFLPKRMGRFSVTFGNSEQSYNSTFLEQLEQKTDMPVNLDSLNLEYYQHYYSSIGARCELANGLLLSAGINYDLYTPTKKNIRIGATENIVINNYYSFAPEIRLQWTPGQYYRMNGTGKEYLNSRYPTVQLEYAQSIEGVLNGDNHYRRLEGAVQQKLPMGLRSYLHYYIGAGLFSDMEKTYFADFQLFQRQNIPQSWNDPIGGTFHELRSEWYRAANSYAQAHFMYETPLLFLYLFKFSPRDILTERLYLSQLYTPALRSYTEIGYGIGNFFCNAGLFVAFDHLRINTIGGKFVLNF